MPYEGSWDDDADEEQDGSAAIGFDLSDVSVPQAAPMSRQTGAVVMTTFLWTLPGSSWTSSSLSPTRRALSRHRPASEVAFGASKSTTCRGSMKLSSARRSPNLPRWRERGRVPLNTK